MWKNSRGLVTVMAGTRAVPLRRELSYQLALCKHEQAERLQMQSELDLEDMKLRDRTNDAWNEAVNLWQQYVAEYGNNQFSGNVGGGANRLLGFALLFSGKRAEASHVWRTERPTSVLEQVGNLYLAKKHEK